MSARKRSSTGKWLLGLALVAGAIGGWLWYRKQAQEDPLDYKTAVVTRGDLTQAVTANGQLSAVKNVTVGSQVSGIITKIHVDFNSRVTNGQLVAEIDPSTYLQNITQSEAEVSNAKAALELAELNMRRARELRTNELISAAEYDKTVVELHQGEAVVQMREASLNKVKVDLARTKIYAPIDGVVISRAVDEGQTVAASFNAPTLFNIANDLRYMRIEAMVSEADVGGVKEGQDVKFTVDAFPGRPFPGKVTQVRYAPVTNQNVVNYTSVVEVNNDDERLRPGMTANASIITAQRQGVLIIPNAALRFRPPDNAVIKRSTNAPAAGGKGTNQMTAKAGGAGAGEMGGPPGEGSDGASREEGRRRFQNMTPEQREEFRSRMRARFGEGGPRGGEGRAMGGRSTPDGPTTRVVYVQEKETSSGKEQMILKPVTIKTGISDGTSTEVLEGLNEGDQVVAGVNLPVGATAAAGNMRPQSGPFGGPFGGGGGFRPR
jgi:HlyD family secretion protein